MSETNPQIYIKGFPRSTRQKDLEQTFQKFGTIKQCRIINGYAFIGFNNEDSMKQAIKEMNNSNFEGSNLIVQAAGNPKRSKGPQPNDECRYCNKLGHWKNSCPQYRKRSGRDGRHRRNRFSSSSSSSSESDRRKKKKRRSRKYSSSDSSSSSSQSSSSSSRSRNRSEKKKSSRKNKKESKRQQ